MNQAILLGASLVAGTVFVMSPAMAWMRADVVRLGRRLRAKVRSAPAVVGSEKGNGVEHEEAMSRMVSEGGQA